MSITIPAFKLSIDDKSEIAAVGNKWGTSVNRVARKGTTATSNVSVGFAKFVVGFAKGVVGK
jgi:hypothetical protein